MLQHKLSTCRNRVTFTRNGTQVSVPCGKCVDCTALRCKHYADLCKREAEAHKYTLFVTLTYDEPNIPKAIMLQSSHNGSPCVDLVDVTTRYYKNGKRKNNPRYRKNIGHIPCDWSNAKFQSFLQKAEKPSKVFGKAAYPYLRVLDKRDVQNFIKSLRFRISETYGEEIRHFTVGEYGGEYFRPHYHIMLFFNSAKLAKNIINLVNQSWQLGFKKCEFAKNRDGLASYVAEYLNSYICIPNFYHTKEIAPFCQHSRFFGTAYYKDIAPHVYEDPANYFEKGSFAVRNKTVNYVPNSYGLNVLYPRCYGFDYRNIQELFKLYTCFTQLSQEYKTDNCSELTKRVLIDANITRHSFLELLDILPSQGYSFTAHCRNYLFLKPSHYYEDFFASSTLLDMTEDDRLLFGRVYRAIHLSKHFSAFICDFGTPKEMIYKIVDFYSQRSLYSLSKMYQMQEEYAQLNVSDHFPDDYYDVFYYTKPDKSYDFQAVYDNNTLVQSSNRLKDLWYADRVKHRKLNDISQMKEFYNFTENE